MNQLLTFCLVLWSFSLQAANWYVRPSSSGAANGTDWNNAWSITGITWASVSAGDTIWMAGGSYSSGLSFGKSGTAGNQISVRRPLGIDATPTSAAGYVSTFTNQIVWGTPSPAVNFNAQSYVTFDARGFDGAVAGNYGASQIGAVQWANYNSSPQPSSPQHSVRLIGITLNGPMSDGVPRTVDCKAIMTDFAGANFGPIDSYIGYCTINGWTEGIELLLDNRTLMEHNRIVNIFYNNGQGGHPDIVFTYSSSDCVFRYNYTYNTMVEGFFCEDTINQYGNFYIYGNVMVKGPLGNGQWGQLAFGKFFVYNNAFIGWNSGATAWGITHQNSQGVITDLQAGSLFQNNIYFNSSSGSYGQTAAISHELTTSTDPFVNSTSSTTPGDYHLKPNSAPINNGTPLPSAGIEPIDGLSAFDPDGHQYGADGLWDQGSYELVNGGGSTNPIMSASPASFDFGILITNVPASFSVTISNLGYSTLNGTGTVSTPFSITSGATYSIPTNQGATMTVKFLTNAAGNYSGTLTLSGGGGASIPLFGLTARVQPGASWTTVSGTIVSPYLNTSGGVLQTSDSSASLAGSGEAVFGFNITTQANYIVTSTFQGTNTGNNSAWLQIDAQPTDPTNVWDATNIVAGFQSNSISWRGSGSSTIPQYSPNIWNLSTGNHYMVLRGREPNMLIQRLNLFLNSTNAPLTNPIISLAITNLDFGGIATNTTKDLTIAISNIGNSNLVGSASVSSPFSVVAGSPYTILTNTSTNITVRFSPTSAGQYSQTVTMTGGGGTNCQVTGIATNVVASVPIISVAPVLLNFGTIFTNLTLNLSLTVSNAGTALLSGSATVSYPFFVISGSPYSLAPGAASAVLVQFAPTNVSAWTTNISLTGGNGSTIPAVGAAIAVPTPGQPKGLFYIVNPP